MAVGSRAGHLFDRHYAAFELFASLVLELNCRVLDVEMVAQYMIQVEQNTGALGWRDVGNGDVAGQGVTLRTQAPDVQIVHVDHAFDALHAGADFGEGDSAGSAFEKDVEGLADDAEAGPEDEGGDYQREDGVDPVMTCEQDGGAAGDDCGGG